MLFKIKTLHVVCVLRNLELKGNTTKIKQN